MADVKNQVSTVNDRVATVACNARVSPGKDGEEGPKEEDQQLDEQRKRTAARRLLRVVSSRRRLNEE